MRAPKNKTTKVGLGQDSHAFDFDDKKKKFILAGINIKGVPPLKGNSDADVVLHAITNAFSSISGVPILGDIAASLSKVFFGGLEQLCKIKLFFFTPKMLCIGSCKKLHSIRRYFF